MSIYFCAGDYCPGYRWPASNVAHPSSCAIERLNSAEVLREVADSRREHGRTVSFDAPEERKRGHYVSRGRFDAPEWVELPRDDTDDRVDDELHERAFGEGA